LERKAKTRVRTRAPKRGLEEGIDLQEKGGKKILYSHSVTLLRKDATGRKQMIKRQGGDIFLWENREIGVPVNMKYT